MLAERVDHVVGIDPDRDRITAAVVTADSGGVIDTAEFSTTVEGYEALDGWANTHTDAESRAWSIEGAGSYGAGVTAHLAEGGEWVIEFDRPTISTRKDRAKTDILDAVRAAREALGRTHLTEPRLGAGRESSAWRRARHRSASPAADAPDRSTAPRRRDLAAREVSPPNGFSPRRKHLLVKPA